LQDKEGGGDAGDENKFDEFMGSDAGMFAGGQYDEDDREADRVWEEIDNFMDERRRVSERMQQVQRSC
jgi:pre-mRNA-processing factor 6